MKITDEMIKAGRLAMSSNGFPRDWETYEPEQIDKVLAKVYVAMRTATVARCACGAPAYLIHGYETLWGERHSDECIKNKVPSIDDPNKQSVAQHLEWKVYSITTGNVDPKGEKDEEDSHGV